MQKTLGVSKREIKASTRDTKYKNASINIVCGYDYSRVTYVHSVVKRRHSIH